MHDEVILEKCQAIIQDMVDRLKEEGVEESEISAFIDFAKTQPYDRLLRDSQLFWNMRM